MHDVYNYVHRLPSFCRGTRDSFCSGTRDLCSATSNGIKSKLTHHSLVAELGGNSLMASRLLNLLKEECPAMQMLDLMESETPFLMAERMVCVYCIGSDNIHYRVAF